MGRVAEGPMKGDVCSCDHQPPQLGQPCKELRQEGVPRPPTEGSAKIADPEEVSRDCCGGKWSEGRACRESLRRDWGADAGTVKERLVEDAAHGRICGRHGPKQAPEEKPHRAEVVSMAGRQREASCRHSLSLSLSLSLARSLSLLHPLSLPLSLSTSTVHSRGGVLHSPLVHTAEQVSSIHLCGG